jgi:hypothetical protein
VATRIFEALPWSDEKVHLHVVESQKVVF